MTGAASLQVVIVNYRSVALTENCVRSLVDHGVASLAEITIVDSCSADDSLPRLRAAFPSGTVVAAQANKGFGAGINLGARYSASDYILVLNPDTYFESNTVGPVLSFLDHNPDVGIVGLDLVDPNGTRQFSARRFYSLLDVAARRVSLFGRILRSRIDEHLMVWSWSDDFPFEADWVMGAGMIVRRSVFEALGGMDELYFLYMEDVDLCARIWQSGSRVVGLPGSYLTHAHQRASAGSPFGWQARTHLASLMRFARKFRVGIIWSPGIAGLIELRAGTPSVRGKGGQAEPGRAASRPARHFVLGILVGQIAFAVVPAAVRSAKASGGADLTSSEWWGPGSQRQTDTRTGLASVAVQDGFAARDKIPVMGGQTYRIALDIAGSGAPPDAVVVQVSFRGPGVDPGWYGPLDAGPLHGHEPALIVPDAPGPARGFAAVLTAPPTADEMILYLRKSGTAGAAAVFSHISVVPTNAAPTTPAAAARDDIVGRAFAGPACLHDRDAALARLTALGIPGEGPPPPHHIAEAGRAVMQIYVARNEDAITLGAAAELAAYLARITGGAFEHLSDDCTPGSLPMIVVGRNNALARSLLGPSALDGLDDDGFIIRSAGAHLLVAGATPRGTMYGVNWLLDRRFNVHWLAPSHTVVPRSPTLELPAQDERQRPRFKYREVLSAEAEDKRWRAHNLMNGESHGPSFTPSPARIDSWRHDWNAKGTVATFYELLPPERFASAHPEWYTGGQIAMMDPGLRAAMAAAVIERLRHDPATADAWFAIHDMDWGWDMDPASRAFADRHGGSPSAPRLDMMVDIADRVRAVFPQARFAFNAYHWSFAPPSGLTVPDYVLVYPMDIQIDYGRPIGIGTNARIGRDLRDWAAIAGNLLVWDHIADFAGYLQPTPNLRTISDNIAWLAKLPQVWGYFAEGSWETPGAEFAALRAWMIARLLWDPTENPQSIVATFCNGYYGPASGPVQRYIALEHAALEQSGDFVGEKAEVDLKMFDLDFLRAADALFDEAARLAAGSDYAEEVAEARLPVDYVILLRRSDLADAGGRGPRFIDLPRRLRRFWETIARAKVTHYMQGGDIEQLRELVAVDRHAAGRPSVTAPGDRWIDLQDLGLNRYDGVPIVADTAASDGAAVRIGPGASGWDVQLKLDKLPAMGSWWLYASVRGDISGYAGVKVGIYPPLNCFDAVSSLSQGPRAYRWIEVPGGPFVHTTDHETGVYVQATGGLGRGDVFLDRFIASDRKLDMSEQPTGRSSSASCDTRTRIP